MQPLLTIQDLYIGFQKQEDKVHVVNGINLQVQKGETLAIVGESGCGKSMTALSIMGLLGAGPDTPNAFVKGSILLNTGAGSPQELVGLSEEKYNDLRGKMLAMIFQEPMSALNPLLTVGEQVAEMFVRHRQLSKKEARVETETLFEKVGIPEPRKRLRAYPFELSGGQKQRVMIAMSICCDPRLLIADEPTTALDVTIQNQILYLLKKIKENDDKSLLFITHNLGIVAQFADRVAVMYRGVIVESAPVGPLFRSPKHPYTKMLLDSLPQKGRRARDGYRLASIPGAVPSPTERIGGCAFHTRCPSAMTICRSSVPPEWKGDNGHTVRCFLEEVKHEE